MTRKLYLSLIMSRTGMLASIFKKINRIYIFLTGCPQLVYYCKLDTFDILIKMLCYVMLVVNDNSINCHYVFSQSKSNNFLA